MLARAIVLIAVIAALVILGATSRLPRTRIVDDGYLVADATLEEVLNDAVFNRMEYTPKSGGNKAWEIIGAGVAIVAVAAGATLAANGRPSPRIQPARRTMPQNLARPSVVRVGRS